MQKATKSTFEKANTAVESEETKKQLEDSLEFCKEKLRDAYMTFKDLKQRCVVDISTWKEKEEKVFYFQPDTFLLDKPEQQKLFREQLMNRISGMPKPEPIFNIGDELHRASVALIADQSTPKLTKRNLATFYHRRQYMLQHLKYKLLCRWAHFALTADQLEKSSLQATQMYGKLEYNLEQAMNRYERLNQDDFYDQAIPENRPHSKAEAGNGSLYVENDLMAPQSLIRDDDVEVYLRWVSYKNKVLKVTNKFLSRLKWLPLQHRYEIFERALILNFEQRKKTIKKQTNDVIKIKSRMRRIHTQKKVTIFEDMKDYEADENLRMNADQEAELKEITNSMFITKYQNFHQEKTEKIQANWRADHDIVPDYVNNTYYLKIKIVEAALPFSLTGDIELDQGYSFAYLISTNFPSYFQKQVIKAQFTLYDGLGHAEQDKNAKQKNILSHITQVDSNIFKDIYTAKNEIPSAEGLNMEIKSGDIKVIRLKSSAYWIDYACLVPTQSDWDKKQEAILNNNNPVDSLLANAFNLLDINDLASINKINEDNALLHHNLIKRLHSQNSHSMIIEKNETTTDGVRNIAIDQQLLKNSNNQANNMEKHLIKTLKGQGFAITGEREGDRNAVKDQKEVPRYKQLPNHLLTCYYTLRFMRSRDSKTKILYVLNYYRSIQKRLSLDLREFGTRERIDSHLKEPFTYPKEAVKNVVTSGLAGFEQAGDKGKSSATFDQNDFLNGKPTVFDMKAIEAMKDFATMRQYKFKGFFNNQVMQTCPAFAKVHFTIGECTVKESEDMEAAHAMKKGGISERSIKLMGRIDKIELNEVAEEVYVKDDFGIYILYDSCLQDMKCLEDHLAKIGSYFLMNSEVMQDPHDDKPMPGKDRLELLDDLLGKEATFQFKKVRLIQIYMEAYEHICDPLEQQRLMQIITDLMALRPRLNLQAGYFMDAYTAEIELLDKQHELLKMLVDMQISLEKTENKSLQDSLCWSYTLANKFEDKKWQYQDAEALLKKFIKLSKAKSKTDKFVRTQMENAKQMEERAAQTRAELIGAFQLEDQSDRANEKKIQEVEAGIYAKELLTVKEEVTVVTLQSAPSQQSSKSGDDDSDEFGEQDYFKVEDNAFQALLGLPEISIETLYQNYKEKDKDIIQLMNEHANFIAVHEGYPEFLFLMQGGNDGTKKARTFKLNQWSQECGNLDFFISLDFVNKYYSVTKQVQQELYDALKPYNPSVMTYIDIAMVEKSLLEYRKVLDFFENRLIEYKGREYIEDESVVGNSEKMIFLSKEMLANLTVTAKAAIDPYLVCKLDVQTIKWFDFMKLRKEDGKYLLERSDGQTISKWLVTSTRKSIIEIAKKKKNIKILQNKLGQDLAAGFVSNLNSSTRKIEVPTQLQIYCNMMEFLRLRNELILNRSETQVLQQVYEEQMKLCGLKTIKIQFEEPVNFDPILQDGEGAEYVNYVDDGPAYGYQIDLAICEFDPNLISNFNFRHPEAFKLCILTSGLEEMRAAVHYQVMQKHLLIVATRTNQLMIDHHCKALSEIKLAESHEITTPNPNIDFLQMFQKSTESVISHLVQEYRAKFKQDLSNVGQKAFYNISARKVQKRTDWIRDHRKFLSKCGVVGNDGIYNQQTIGRIMRCFKVLIMTRYCQEVLLKVHLDAQKIQGLNTCQKLRILSRYLDFDISRLSPEKNTHSSSEDSSQIFKLETANFMFENHPNNYIPKGLEDRTYNNNHDAEIRVFNHQDIHIYDYFGIPSSISLMLADATNPIDLQFFKNVQKQHFVSKHGQWVEDLCLLDHTDKYSEDNLKKNLPTFTPKDLDGLQEQTTSEQQKHSSHEEDEAQLIKKHGHPILDYEEAMQFSKSKFANCIRYYQHLERIFALEWFVYKLQFKQTETVFMDQAFETGLPFWHETAYEKKIKQAMPQIQLSTNINALSQKLLYSRIVAKKQKKDIAEELNSMSMTIKNLIQKFKDKYLNSKDVSFEYLQSYTEYRYMQIISSMTKLVQQFYMKPKQAGRNAVKCLKNSISHIIKMDHVKIAYTHTNNYHVNTALVHPQYQLIDSTNFISGAYQDDERANFLRCVLPVVNEKALEPSQLTLFQSLYSIDNFRKKMPTQFGGQFISTHNSVAFKAFETALLDITQEERSYCQSYIVQMKFQANDFMEMAQNETSLKNMQNEDVYDLQQLQKAKAFISDQTQPLLLKNAIMCWTENTVLPDDPLVYDQFEANFRQQFFWKIVQQKEMIIKAITSNGKDTGLPSKEKLKKLKDQIQKLQDDYTLATKNEEEQRNKMIKLLTEEFNEMKKKVCYDNLYTNKAEIQVLKNEIEKFIIKAATQTLENESNALMKCFNIAVPSIQMHIHPFQQFAATFYDEVDPNWHLDVSQKLGFVQSFLTKLRNRGTKVDTLTSGPGMVFTIKDINDCMQEFCKSLLKYGEKELKSRSDLLFQKESHYMNMLYNKDQRLKNYENRALLQQKNIANLINGKLFEKGNQMIYQLDSQSRLLTLFKQTMFSLEREIRTTILGEMSHKIKLQQNFVDTARSRFDGYMQKTYSSLASKLSEQEDKLKKHLEAEYQKIVDIQVQFISNEPVDLKTIFSKKPYYPSDKHLSSQVKSQNLKTETSAKPNNRALVQKEVIAKQSFPGTIVPVGFIHKTRCDCFDPNLKYPLPTMEMAELEMMSEQEARYDLANNIATMQKLRVYWRTKLMFSSQKYQDQINLLKKQLNNNSYLWDQMAETEKREKILKQELLFTQQSLSSAEKVIEKLQEEMKKLESERERLAKYKNSKAQRLKDLEDRVKKQEVFENIDIEKLIDVLGKKDIEVKNLKDISKFAETRVDNAEQQKNKAIKQINQKFLKEQEKTQQIMDKMEQMKLELKMLETSDQSVASIWKRKCLDMFEVCQTLKTENEELRDRCKELIYQGLQLSDVVNQSVATEFGPTQSLDDAFYPGKLNLPKLGHGSAKKTSYLKQVGNISVGITSGRQGTSTANTYATNLMRAGISPENRDSHGRDGGSMHGETSVIDELNSGRGENSYDLRPSKQFEGSIGPNSTGPPQNFTSMMNNTMTKKFDHTRGVTHSIQEENFNLKNASKRRLRVPGAPNTAYQNQRGKTLGPAGPLYFMPQTAAAGVDRNASLHDKAASNLSAHLQSQDKKYKPNILNSEAPREGLNTSIQIHGKAGGPMYKPREERNQLLPQTQLKPQTMIKAHNDSLFESSKVSTAYRAHFNSNMDAKNKRKMQYKPNQSTQPSGLDNSGITGSKIQPTMNEISSHHKGTFESSIQKGNKREDSIFGIAREVSQTQPLVSGADLITSLQGITEHENTETPNSRLNDVSQDFQRMMK